MNSFLEEKAYHARLHGEDQVMDVSPGSEEFDTGLAKIRHEIKSHLASHGLWGSVTSTDLAVTEPGVAGSRIQIIAKGRTVERVFDRQQIVDCRLRVGGAVLLGIIAMVGELAAPNEALS